MVDDWMREFRGAITVCDQNGTMLYLNDAAAESYADRGGRQLLGSNLLDCHPEPARSKVLKLLQVREPNIYTIEKRGVKKMVYQAPWYRDGNFCGLVELVLEIPVEMSHFVRG